MLSEWQAHPSIREVDSARSGVQVYLQLHMELKAVLGYTALFQHKTDKDPPPPYKTGDS